MDYPGGPKVITRVLNSRRGRQEKRTRERPGYRRKAERCNVAGSEGRATAKECGCLKGRE